MRKVSTWRELLAETTYELPYGELSEMFLVELENAVPAGATEGEIWARAFDTIAPITHAVVQEIAQRDIKMYATVTDFIRRVLLKCIEFDAEDEARWALEDASDVCDNVIPFPIGGRYGHTPDDCA
ncbi:hypothetical protein BSK66_07690 [Paenibacillus odorifer]|uniref:Uncharacterized protein n=1 Tax=Paenibacillus odorifer TaxID=189426 RepID=A0A1R0X2M5_9BACL|nr:MULTISPECIES: hypothetical protein [Paenibacillus]ETT64884.1 hypothetical protein C171_07707 [Paenibacillus sp. FSL H8-237]OMD27441.1 hypothetical protein BJP51_24920 [Paenibacillus odorifer]OME61003.1 hypothetical protein BSK66_07690 [Paenibacillus odorifer]